VTETTYHLLVSAASRSNSLSISIMLRPYQHDKPLQNMQQRLSTARGKSYRIHKFFLNDSKNMHFLISFFPPCNNHYGILKFDPQIIAKILTAELLSKQDLSNNSKLNQKSFQLPNRPRHGRKPGVIICAIEE